MDDLDARMEVAEAVDAEVTGEKAPDSAVSDFGQEVSGERPVLRIVPPLPDEAVLDIEREDILRTVIGEIDFGVPLTQQARDFLYRAILPVLQKISVDMKGEMIKSKARELASFAFQIFSATGIFGIPAEKRIPQAVRQMIFDNFLLGEALDRHEGRWPNTHGKMRSLSIAKEAKRTRERLQEAAVLSAELEQMDGSENSAQLRAKLQAGARMLEWLDRAKDFRQDTIRAEVQFAHVMKNDRTDVDCVVDNPEDALAFFAPLFERQFEEPVDGDFVARTFQERDWYGLKYPDSAVHPLLAVHEIARRSCREKFGRDKQYVLRQDLLRMVFDEGRPLLTLFERVEERQFSFGPFHEPKVFRVSIERRFVPWQP